MSIIKPKSAIALVVNKGEVIRVTDVEGGQVADFVCFNLHDTNEFLSQAETRVVNEKLRITTGDKLYSDKNNVMFTIIDDKVGVHDILYSACNSFVYEEIYKVGPRNGCRENLAKALKPHNITKVPCPFNIFMNTVINEDYKVTICQPISKSGDFIELEANMDCLVAISSCAEDIGNNLGKCTPIQVDVVKISK